MSLLQGVRYWDFGSQFHW